MSTETRNSLPCLSVVVPVYNEESTLETVVSKLLALQAPAGNHRR